MRDYNFVEMEEQEIINAIEETCKDLYEQLSDLESRLYKLHRELYNDSSEIRFGINVLKNKFNIEQDKIDVMTMHYYSLKAKIQAVSMANTMIGFADH